jgi:mono/diheme cytochrome c family protein
VQIKAIVAASAFASALLAGSASAADGPFTQEQAADGKTRYNNQCATCHRPNLKGGQGPALIGDDFKNKWAGKPVAELRDYTQRTMPPTAPGSLPDDQIDPIIAFILSENGVAPGQTALSKDSASAEFPK